ncbi:HNH endonuclease [Actinomadura madurae]|uniref:HNH endonuclease signature motif containing protein n=1 Tax=Actinomadura madurae TaxID=1993 RepID=UPI002025F409|nr:HNH endonuclease signature motif containing protein [Actinomadura madurae]URM94910.1 HNH endonuclease [Actinomadura madurae]
MSVSAGVVVRQREWEDRAWFPPGPQLAICLSGGKERLADLTDDELLQVAAAARRQTSWAQARELAAIAELHQRRTRAEADVDYRILSAQEAVTEEVSAALSVTGNTAATLVHLAERLVGPLAATGAALEAGRIDLSKARAISDATETLPDEAIEKVEAAALEKASTQTTGQLRRRIKRLAERLAPEAVEDRKREAVRQRRLQIWDTPSGTTDLTLCDLAAEDAHAIFNKITAAAHGLKQDGDTRPLNLIRADLATQLLHGANLPAALRALLAGSPDDLPTTRRTVGHECGRPDAAESASGSLSLADSAEPGVSEFVEGIERRLTHVRDRVQPERLPIAIRRAAQRIHHELSEARDAACRGRDERHGRPGYRAPAALRLEIEARHATCVFPTCNQPVHRCDLDHTIPWRPGTTCRCNLAPLCRRHHRLKQTPGWKLHQVLPGILLWITPSGAWYIVRPDRR